MFIMLLSCCCMDKDIFHHTPASPLRASDILLWKCSGADEMQGQTMKQYRLKVVMNVVKSEELEAHC